jgi:HEAT repeat protein
VIAVCLATIGVAAQAPSPPGGITPLATVLAQGWSALAQGELTKASSAAQQALAEAPRSAGAVALAVEVEIVRGGPGAGLETYERWLDAKRVDEAYVLRRVAAAYLDKAVRQREGGTSRIEALKALVADGDQEAVAALAKAAEGGALLETRLMASRGDRRAVQNLTSQLKTSPDKLGTVNALVESGSKLAIPPLLELLTDVRDEHRAAAADGLGRLGAHEVIDRIKPLLNDQNFTVRMTAAAALYRLDDNSGVTLLDQLLTSDHAAVRLGAAEALSVRPGGAWQSVARALTADPDQTVQLGAAKLIAPYDRALAENVLERLRQSENPAIREEAARIIAERIANDFATLRRLLRSTDSTTVVRAASRILELTR